nr:SpoIIE family protein phosphatase [Streptomyces sp. SID8377]
MASAGHLPALLRHRSGRTEVLDVPPGLLLGVDVAAEYRAAEVPIPPGHWTTWPTNSCGRRSGPRAAGTTSPCCWWARGRGPAGEGRHRGQPARAARRNRPRASPVSRRTSAQVPSTAASPRSRRSAGCAAHQRARRSASTPPTAPVTT